MQDGAAAQHRDRLEAAVTADPGAPGFAALAEIYRREGRLADAEAVLRNGLSAKPDAWEGSVALALVLLDRDHEQDARETLEGLIEASASIQGALAGQGETSPEPQAEAAPEALDLPAPDPVDLPVGAPFATGTMADLLERQGDVAGAERIRASLDEEVLDEAAGDVPSPTEVDSAGYVLDELSRWLVNAQQRIAERA